MRSLLCVAAPDLHTLALFAGEDAETVVLHFVQPTWPGGRVIGERGLARADEADWGISSPRGAGAFQEVTQKHEDPPSGRANVSVSGWGPTRRFH